MEQALAAGVVVTPGTVEMVFILTFLAHRQHMAAVALGLARLVVSAAAVEQEPMEQLIPEVAEVQRRQVRSHNHLAAALRAHKAAEVLS